MDFKTDNCPKTKKCEETVWYKSKCIHRSTLGNIAFGYLAGVFGIGEGAIVFGVNSIGGRRPGEGADNPEDVGGIAIGYYAGKGKAKIGEKIPDEGNFEANKKFFSTWSNWEIWATGWTDPWKEIGDAYNDCKKCDDTWKGPGHEMPGESAPGMK